jgi:NOL1/NOP2/sun family putative RNA methylase
MSGKNFFVGRYEQMGWEYSDVSLEQAIRINTARAPPEEVVERLRARGVKLEKIPFLESGYKVRGSRFSVGATSEYLLGLYSIQEAAAQIPVTVFTEIEGKMVLDACAAPGGKTVQLADAMRNSGVIVALDIKRPRLFALANQLERCRVENTVAYQLDARRVSRLGMKFDRILLDVPCSGNYAQDPHWLARRTVQDVKRNAQVQRQMLSEAVKVLASEGQVVYATCSLEPEENELNIDWAIKTLNLKVEKISCHGEEALTSIFGRRLDSMVSNCRRIWPGKTQGFFVCRLRQEV